MAKPIEPTPTLSGKDAQEVIIEVENTIHSEKKEIFLKKCKEAYEQTK